MRSLVLIGLTFCVIQTSAQSVKDILIGGSFDLVKTDISQAFDKAQAGIEGHYFVARRFAFGAGAEVWTTPAQSSLMLGARYYPIEKLFFRVRGLIGVNDIAVGAGWSHPLTDRVRIEAMTDYYILSSEFALRIGAAYVIKLKN